MGINRNNFVCCDCRKSSRISCVCSCCHIQMVGIGYKWRVPKFRDKKGWKLLADLIEQQQKELVVRNRPHNLQTHDVFLTGDDLCRLQRHNPSMPYWRIHVLGILDKPDNGKLFLNKGK